MPVKRIAYIIFGLSSFFVQLSAQNFVRSSDWKKYRKEVIFQAGISEFLGDLGGRNQIGKDYSPVDLEFSMTRPAVSVAYRYKITKFMNWHTSFNYMMVSGNDNLTSEPYRNNRNLNFKSNIFELATRIELGYFSNKVGHRYGIRRTLSKRMKSRSWEVVGFVGIGGFYYNPKGKGPSGWVKLRPLHTEGQGLPGGPKQYSNYAVSIPMGVAYRMILSKKWCVGLEINYRKTFTDYIDDVSTVYYDNAALKANYGDLSAAMADPSKGLIYGATAPNGDGTGAQRGDKQKDSYMTFQVTVGHFFGVKKGKARLRSKF